MAKIPGDAFFPARGAALRGSFYVSTNRTGQFVSRWPKKRGKARTPKEAANQTLFSGAMTIVKNMDTSIQAFAAEVAKDVPLLPRDLLMWQLYGQSNYFVMPDGRKVFSMAALQDVSLLLDAIWQTKNGILVRGESLWQGLPPALPGHVLGINDDGDLAYVLQTAGATIKILAHGTVANVATIDLDLNAYMADYSKLDVYFQNLIPAVDNATLRARIGTGSPPTYHTGSGDYKSGYMRVFTSGGPTGGGGITDHIPINDGNGTGNGAAEGITAYFKTGNYAIATSKPRWQWDSDAYTDNDLSQRTSGSGFYNAAGQGTGLRVYFHNGNIASGTYKVVGYAI